MTARTRPSAAAPGPRPLRAAARRHAARRGRSSIAGLLLIGARHRGARLGPAADPTSAAAADPARATAATPASSSTPTPSNEVVVPTEPPGLEDPGHARVRQGRQHLGPDRRQGDAAHDGRQRLDAVLHARTARRCTSCGRARPTARGASTASIRDYTLDVPALMRVAVDGRRARRGSSTGSSTRPGRPKWMGFIREPGRLARRQHDRDGDRPARPDQERRHAQAPQPREQADHGPGARPGRRRSATRTRRGGPTAQRLAYVRDDRDGAKGTPRIYLYTPENGRTRAITGPGYLQPSWSPDGRYLAATRTQRDRDGRRDPRRRERRRAPPADQRRRQLGAHVVAGRGPDRLLPHRGPGRGPADGPARGQRAHVDRQGDRST